MPPKTTKAVKAAKVAKTKFFATLSAEALKKAMRALVNPARAEHSLRFFKTGPGEYGEGDKFLGLTVPQIRDIAKRFMDMPPEETRKLLDSPWHEHRLVALLIWVMQYRKAEKAEMRAANRTHAASTSQRVQGVQGRTQGAASQQGTRRASAQRTASQQAQGVASQAQGKAAQVQVALEGAAQASAPLNSNPSAVLRTTLHQAFMDAVAAGRVNNWDLVDSSAETLFGSFARGEDGEPRPAFRKKLHALAQSPSLWERRVAMLSVFHNIRQGHFIVALEIAEVLVHDSEDLMHKAVGWMLREIGKRDRKTLNRFLDKHAASMPRTALRYALEHSSAKEKTHYMAAKARLMGQVADSARPSLSSRRQSTARSR